MQQVNFGAMDFSKIPQAEQEARRRYYQSLSDMAGSIGKGAQDIGSAMYKDEQDRLAEEWRKTQWQNTLDQQEYQHGRDAIMDARYDAEQLRLLKEQQAQQEATERLRQQFIRENYPMNLDEYGLPAKFAMAQISNARNWNDIVAGGQSLAQVMQYRDALRAQQAEQQQMNVGPQLNQRIGGEMAAYGMDFGRLGDVYRATPRSSRGDSLRRLQGWRDQLNSFATLYPERMTPEMSNRLNDLNNAIRYWNRQMGRRPSRF